MILTGKAKKDFEKWLENYSKDFGTVIHASLYGNEWEIDVEELFDKLPLSIQNILIIEWFESLDFNVFDLVKNAYELDDSVSQTIIDANKYAVEKANDTYNLRS